MAAKKAEKKQARITQYRATWDVKQHKGLIEVRIGPEAPTPLAFSDPAEFAAVAAMLQCDPDVWLIDDSLISTQVQAPGIALSK